MATHFGKEGVVTAGGTGIGELTGYTLETTADVVEDTQLSDATKSFLAGRTSFSGSFRNISDHGAAERWDGRSISCRQRRRPSAFSTTGA